MGDVYTPAAQGESGAAFDLDDGGWGAESEPRKKRGWPGKESNMFKFDKRKDKNKRVAPCLMISRSASLSSGYLATGLQKCHDWPAQSSTVSAR